MASPTNPSTHYTFPSYEDICSCPQDGPTGLTTFDTYIRDLAAKMANSSFIETDSESMRKNLIEKAPYIQWLDATETKCFVDFFCKIADAIKQTGSVKIIHDNFDAETEEETKNLLACLYSGH